MNTVKIQYKALIFKSCFLLLLFVFIVFPTLKAQSLVDTNDVKNLYDSALYYRNTNYDKAIQYFNKILELKSKIPEDINPEYFKVYNWLGIVHRKQGNLQKAIEYNRYALENTSDTYYKTIINDNIAIIYTFTGDFTKAIYYLENSLAILKKSDNERKYIYIINNYLNQGHAFYKSGQINLALEKDLECIRIAKENNLNADGSIYYNTGLAYQALDSLNKADFYFKEAIITYIRNFGENYYMTAMAYKNYATFYVETGKIEKSEHFYQKAYRIFINTLDNKHLFTSYCLRDLGNLYTKKGNYKEALNYYQKSLASKINNFNDSSIYVNPSPNVFPDLDLLNVLKAKAQALEMLATQENKETNLKAALSTLELTVGYIEQLRMGYLYENSKLVLAEKEHETYMSIIKIAYDLLNITGDKDYINVAFKYSERSKYAILKESIDEESARNIASIPDSVQNHIQGIKEQIGNIRLLIENENKLVNPDGLKQNELKRKLFRLTQSREKTIKKLEQNYPKYYKRKYENKVVEISELQLNLIDKEAVISYELTDSVLFTFIITNKSHYLTSNKVDSAFYNNLEAYKEFLHSENNLPYGMFRKSSYGLYKVLIEPIEDYIVGKNLIIVPDSEMSLIAFESFTNEPYVKKVYADYRDVPYLIKKYPMGYAFSATLLYNSKKKEKVWNPKFLGFAPDYKNNRDSLRFVAKAESSLKQISRIVMGKIFINEEATEHNLKSNINDYGIIHFYAYGNEDRQNPDFSKIYLSYNEDTVEDGYLYAYEVDELDLNAELIVLASCFSGSGSVKKGEGVLSIGRRFMNADNPSLIMSLWLAYYKPTFYELRKFYWNLAKGMRKDEAIRLAKLDYIESTNILGANPKYWASLVVVGNQDPIFRRYFAKRIVFILTAFIIVFLILFMRKRKAKNSNK
ncbi:MAG: CHAT domain-containing protein [Bacteroidales bacterium]|nr:CHAT domain-containing protein [Bacteroidales bacterium]